MYCFPRLSLGFAFLHALLLAQEPPPIARVPVRLIIAPTSVTDARGKFISGIQTEDFSLRDNNVLQTVHEDADFLPISLVVAIQTNLEVEAIKPKIQQLGPLLGTLVVGEGGEAAILTFNRTVAMLQDFTGDLGRLTSSLRRVEFTQDKSHLIDATLHAIRMLENRPKERRRILLLISETRDQGSESKLRDAVAEAEVHNILIYSLNVSRSHAAKQLFLPSGGGIAIDIVGIVKEMYGTVKMAVVENPLSVLTRYTGGRQYSFFTERALEDAIAKVGEEIHGQYLLSYSPVNTPGEGYHEIRVTINRPDLLVRSRPGYYWGAGDFLADPPPH